MAKNQSLLRAQRLCSAARAKAAVIALNYFNCGTSTPLWMGDDVGNNVMLVVSPYSIYPYLLRTRRLQAPGSELLALFLIWNFVFAQVLTVGCESEPTDQSYRF